MLLILFFLNLTYADMQLVAKKSAVALERAMPAPRHLIKLSEVKEHFTKNSNPEILKLISVAEVLELTNLSSQGSKPETVQVHEITQAIREALHTSSAWEKKLTPQQIVVVDTSQETLKQHFTDQGMEWAWVLKTMGQDAASKALLVNLFEKKSSELLNTRFLFKSENPLSQLTTIDRVLTPQSSKEENQARSQKLQKVKTHISNLPDATIMT